MSNLRDHLVGNVDLVGWLAQLGENALHARDVLASPALATELVEQSASLTDAQLAIKVRIDHPVQFLVGQRAFGLARSCSAIALRQFHVS